MKKNNSNYKNRFILEDAIKNFCYKCKDTTSNSIVGNCKQVSCPLHNVRPFQHLEGSMEDISSESVWIDLDEAMKIGFIDQFEHIGPEIL